MGVANFEKALGQKSGMVNSFIQKNLRWRSNTCVRLIGCHCATFMAKTKVEAMKMAFEAAWLATQQLLLLNLADLRFSLLVPPPTRTSLAVFGGLNLLLLALGLLPDSLWRFFLGLMELLSGCCTKKMFVLFLSLLCAL
eukprot:6035018-Amphidinium_carterae.9